jgi:hypothetical protein
MKSINIKILFFGFIIVLFYSCEKDPIIEPIRYDPVEYDLNNDLINDISISYLGYSWDGIGPDGSGMGINGVIKPLNDTKILYKQDIGSLFLNSKDTLKLFASIPLSWISNESYVINIKTHLNQYVNPWTIIAPETKDQYNVGFKLSNDNSTILGWFKLRINCYNGKIDLTEKKMSNQNILVID